MAAQLYLLTVANADDPQTLLIDGITHCIVNSDDGGADAVKIAEAVASAVSIGIPLPTGYFDTVELLGPPTAGIMTTDEDAIFIPSRSRTDHRDIA